VKSLAFILAVSGLFFVGCTSTSTQPQSTTNPTTHAAEDFVAIEMRFVTVTRAVVAEFGLSKDITILTPWKVSLLFRYVEAGRSGVRGPRAAIGYGQDCHVSEYTHLPYVSDYETRKTADNPVGIVTPVWNTQDTGIIAMVRADPAQGGAIDLTAYINYQLLHGWKDVPAPSNKTLTVRVPDVHRVEFLRHMNLHSQETAVCFIDRDPLLGEGTEAEQDIMLGSIADAGEKHAPTTNPGTDDSTEVLVLIKAIKLDATGKSHGR